MNNKLKDLYNINFYGRPLLTMIKPGNRVLEIGCGNNSLLVRSSMIVQRKLKVTGIDIFKPYVDYHNARNIYQVCYHADITAVEFELDQFDVVVCMDVLEHLTKDEGIKLLSDMTMWARTVIVTTPNGFIPGVPQDSNKYREHKSGWTTTELRHYGYKVRGTSGLKPLRRPDSQLRHEHPFIFWAGLSFISDALVYFLPNLAFHLQATYVSRER